MCTPLGFWLSRRLCRGNTNIRQNIHFSMAEDCFTDQTKVKEWKFISIVCRLGSCSSSSNGNDVIFMPWAVERFPPDRKFPPFSPWPKCNILFRAPLHPVRKLRVATVTTKGQIKARNWNTMQTTISWKCLFKLRITSTLQQWPGHDRTRQ